MRSYGIRHTESSEPDQAVTAPAPAVPTIIRKQRPEVAGRLASFAARRSPTVFAGLPSTINQLGWRSRADPFGNQGRSFRLLLANSDRCSQQELDGIGTLLAAVDADQWLTGLNLITDSYK